MHVMKPCVRNVLTVALSAERRADEWDKKTILTFSGPCRFREPVARRQLRVQAPISPATATS